MENSRDRGLRNRRRMFALLVTCSVLAPIALGTTAQANARAPEVRSGLGHLRSAPRPGGTPMESELGYSTYLGGSDYDSWPATARDRFGDLYLAGDTCSSNFPTTPGAYRPSPPGGCDVFVTKLSPDGGKLIYSTYLGGSDFESAGGIDVDASGNAYVSGETLSADFPTTPGAFQTSSRGGVDAFVTKLSPSGSALVYSTYLGGSGDDWGGVGGSISVAPAGRITVGGFTGSLDFPVTQGAFQETFAGGDGSHCGFPCDLFVARLNRAGSGLVYSTYLGGTGDDGSPFVAVDRYGRTHITGQTDSTDFPTTAGAFQETASGGGGDMFVVDLNSSGSGLVYSTYLGGPDDDFPAGLSMDHEGNAFVAGGSTGPGFPTTPGVFEPSSPGSLNGTLTKLSPSGSALVYSTYLGATGEDLPGGLAVDGGGNAYFSGVTDSTDLPITPDAIQPTFAGGGDGTICFGLPCDAFLMKLSHDASSLLYSTYLGGSGDDWASGRLEVDGSGNVYVPGYTSSTDFPTTPRAFQTTLAGFVDAFITKIDLGKADVGQQVARHGPPTPERDRPWPAEPTPGWPARPRTP